MASMTGNQSANVSGTKYIDSRCIVEFRPDDKWQGEYGFDWYRRGDIVENINGIKTTSSYVGIVGEYMPKDPDYGEDAAKLHVNKAGAYPEKHYYADKLARDEYPIFKIKGLARNYIVPYISLYFESEQRNQRTLPNTMLYKGSDGSYYRHQFCKVEASIKLLIEARSIQRIDFVCDDELSVSPKTIRNIPDGQSSNQKVTISFKYMFDGEPHKAVKVFAYHNDGTTKTFAGQINIVRCVPKAVDICFVNVKTRLNDTTVSVGMPNFTFIDNQMNYLRGFLAQAHIIPKISIKDLDFTDTSNYKAYYHNRLVLLKYGWNNVEITTKLERLFDQKYPNNNAYKVFFLGEKGLGGSANNYYYLAGHAKDIPAKSLVIYNNPEDDSTVTHELLHCFGLWHSFSNKSKHTFEKKKTNNIMDYSKDTISLWRWQWEKINNADGLRVI